MTRQEAIEELKSIELYPNENDRDRLEYAIIEISKIYGTRKWNNERKGLLGSKYEVEEPRDELLCKSRKKIKKILLNEIEAARNKIHYNHPSFILEVHIFDKLKRWLTSKTMDEILIKAGLPCFCYDIENIDFNQFDNQTLTNFLKWRKEVSPLKHEQWMKL